MTAFLNVLGTLADPREAFTIAVIIGSSSVIQSLSRKVGMGSNVQDLVGVYDYFLNLFLGSRQETI